MKQSNYDTIVSCINHGAPAIAHLLLADLNQTVELANDQITYLKEREAEAKRKAEIHPERTKPDQKAR